MDNISKIMAFLTFGSTKDNLVAEDFDGGQVLAKSKGRKLKAAVIFIEILDKNGANASLSNPSKLY